MTATKSTPPKSTHGGRRPGAGRPRHADRGLETRSRVVSCKLTDSEYETLLAAAGLDRDDVPYDDLASWVRDRLLGLV